MQSMSSYDGANADYTDGIYQWTEWLAEYERLTKALKQRRGDTEELRALEERRREVYEGLEGYLHRSEALQVVIQTCLAATQGEDLRFLWQVLEAGDQWRSRSETLANEGSTFAPDDGALSRSVRFAASIAATSASSQSCEHSLAAPAIDGPHRPFRSGTATGTAIASHAPQQRDIRGAGRAGVAPAGGAVLPPLGSLTTLTVRNIPTAYSQEELLQEWPVDRSYDYLHFPYSDSMGRSIGIAFINFLSPELAAQFRKRWHGRSLGRHATGKMLRVEPAKVQGRNANLELVKQDARVLPVVLYGDEVLDPRRVLDFVGRAQRGTCPIRV